MKDEPETIFDFSHTDWKYKGIIFAEMDVNELNKQSPVKFPDDYIVGFMGIIWVDENEDWQVKGRFKFPSGNKDVISNNFGKNCNETKILQTLYEMPMRNKKWYKNKTEDIEGMYEVLQESNMIESIRVIESDESK